MVRIGVTGLSFLASARNNAAKEFRNATYFTPFDYFCSAVLFCSLRALMGKVTPTSLCHHGPYFTGHHDAPAKHNRVTCYVLDQPNVEDVPLRELYCRHAFSRLAAFRFSVPPDTLRLRSVDLVCFVQRWCRTE